MSALWPFALKQPRVDSALILLYIGYFVYQQIYKYNIYIFIICIYIVIYKDYIIYSPITSSLASKTI